MIVMTGVCVCETTLVACERDGKGWDGMQWEGWVTCIDSVPNDDRERGFAWVRRAVY